MSRFQEQGEERVTAAHFPAGPVAACAAAFFLTPVLLAAAAGADGLVPVLMRLIAALGHDVPVAALWMLAAAGWGRGLQQARRAGNPGAGDFSTLQSVAIGAGILMFLDWGLGALGLLNTATAWGLSAAGLVLAVLSMRSQLKSGRLPPEVCVWADVLPCVAAGVLGVCAAVPPGILWPSEFGAYDALSYHLQLPKEWMAAGKISGLQHNVYSYLPGGLEAAFMHLGLLCGGMNAAAGAAQQLHAMFAVLTALLLAEAVGHVAAPEVRRVAQSLTAAVYLSVPWVLVTGSLAYNEQAMMAFGAAGLSVVLENQKETGFQTAVSRGLRLGFFCGMATLVKLTAVALIGLPLGVMTLLLATPGWRRKLQTLAFAAVAGGLLTGCWMMRNFLWCGQPVFPMLTDWLGSAHWTAEQAARWKQAHQPHVGLGEAFRFLFSEARGLWHAQFAVLIWLAALAGAAMALAGPELRRRVPAFAVLLSLQVLMWVFLTHHQSRFLIPLLLGAAVLAGLGLSARGRGLRLRQSGVMAVVLWQILCGGVLFAGFARAFPVGLFIGDSGPMVRMEPGQKALTCVAAANGLPAGSRVYAEALATVFHIEAPCHYHTVWDQSPLGAAAAQGGAAGAVQWLQQQGYTHVVIDWTMLSVWNLPENYGYDPNLPQSVLAEIVKLGLEPVEKFEQEGRAIYRVKAGE